MGLFKGFLYRVAQNIEGQLRQKPKELLIVAEKCGRIHIIKLRPCACQQSVQRGTAFHRFAENKAWGHDLGFGIWGGGHMEDVKWKRGSARQWYHVFPINPEKLWGPRLSNICPVPSFFCFFEDVEKKVGLKSPKLHTPR